MRVLALVTWLAGLRSNSMLKRPVLAAGLSLGALAVFALMGAAALWTRQPAPPAPAAPAIAQEAAVFSPSPPAPIASPSEFGPAAQGGVQPVPRAGAVMVYDPENHGVIMFGGAAHVPTADGSNSVSLGDTWLWNGSAWSPLGVSGPSPRNASVAAYDSVRHVIVLFGGSGPAGIGPAKLFDDTWTWDGAAWTQQFPVHQPNPRFDAAMAFDQRRGVTVMYGGWGQTETYDATWTWDGADWTLQDPPASPGARHFFSMAYDDAAGVTVLFGGTLPGQRLNDTWTWDGVTWTKQTAPAPVASGWSFLAYDAASKEVVAYVYFAIDNQPIAEYTITWNGTRWTDRTSPSDPSPRVGIAMAYDVEKSRVVMFGPSDGGPETWMWNGVTWAVHS